VRNDACLRALNDKPASIPARRVILISNFQREANAAQLQDSCHSDFSGSISIRPLKSR